MVSLNYPAFNGCDKRSLDVNQFLGTNGYPCYVAIKGIVFDVGKKEPYQPGGSYSSSFPVNYPHVSSSRRLGTPRSCGRLTCSLRFRAVICVLELSYPYFRWPLLTRLTVFAAHDASRALAKTSTNPADVLPEWQDLDDKEKGVLQDWFTFFSKRYNVVGTVEGASNFDPEIKIGA